ncbi:unnamed protein product [Calypogeia fissa]
MTVLLEYLKIHTHTFSRCHKTLSTRGRMQPGIVEFLTHPVALTEEPAGADLIFEQGDNITGKIAREEVARSVVAVLNSPAAVDTTFEVKSTVRFSELFTVDPNNPPAKRDYANEFESLKTGVDR